METEIRLYQENDFAESRKERNAMIRRMLFFALPFLAGAAAAFALRLEALCIFCAVAFCSVLVFLYDLLVKPAVTYDRHLGEIQRGSSHDTLGTLVSVSKDLTYAEGINFREVIINIYEDMDEEGERRFLLDERRELPQEWMNRDVVISSYGNVVAGARLYIPEVKA